MNKKGFTLTELLVAIAILAIVVSLGIGGYILYQKQAKEYAYERSRDSLISSAILYYQEKELKPIASIDDKNYYCITVRDLINYGYHDEKEIKNVDRITLDTYIKITENINTQTREKQELISNDVLDICNIASQKLIANTKEVYSNKVISEIEKLKFYNNYTCYYKQDNNAYITGEYIDGDEYGYCHFNNLAPNTNYTYKACATAEFNSKEYEACSDEIKVTTKSIETPKIEEYSYFISNIEYKISDGYNFNTWSNDKVINLKYNYEQLNPQTTYIMFYVDTSNTVKVTNTNILKCNNSSCTTTSNIAKNTLLQSGWYGLKIDDNKTKSLTLRINKSNVNIQAKIYDGTNNSQIVNYKSSKIDNVKPNISSISQTNNYNSSTKQSQIKITTYDADSGVDKIYISKSNKTPTLNSTGWTTLSNTTYQTYLDIETTYYMWVMDKAKNISTIKSYYVTNPDKEPPVITTTIPSYWTQSGKNVQIKITDNVSLKSYKVYKSNNSSNIVASKTYTSTKTSDTFSVYLDNNNYTVYACDTSNNCSSKNISKSSLYIDNTPPSVGTYRYNGRCSGDNLYFNYTISPKDIGSGSISVYQYISTSSSTPSTNSNLWEYYSTYNTLPCGKTYYLHIKLVDAVGNVTRTRLDSRKCNCPAPEPVQDSDCKIICIMRKARDNWHGASSSDKIKWHAINSILAGDVKYPSQMIYVGGNVGSWYYKGEVIETWYNKNCSPSTTCENPTWENYNNKRYAQYNFNTNVASCSLYDEQYPSGECKNGVCYCCKRGTGWYGGTCYDK